MERRQHDAVVIATLSAILHLGRCFGAIRWVDRNLVANQPDCLVVLECFFDRVFQLVDFLKRRIDFVDRLLRRCLPC